MTAGGRLDEDDVADAPYSVALAVEDTANRELLGEWFRDRGYEVAVPGTAAEFGNELDLCVVDAAGYRRHQQRLETLKDSVSPAFLPYLFVAGDDRALEDADVWDRFDEVVVTPLRPGELAGRVEGLLDRRRLSRELSAAEQRFRTLFQSTPDPIVALDGGTVLDVNVGFCRLVAVDRSECVGRPLEALPGLSAGAVESIRAVVDGDAGAADPTVTFTDADGQQRVAELDVARVADRDYVVVRFRDVSERVLRERELRRQNQRLDEFAEVLDHDLRRSLNRVTEAVQPADADVDRGSVLAAVARAEALIDELLALSETADVVASPQSVELGGVTRDAWAAVDAGDAALRVELGGDESLTADRARLQEALENLFEVLVERGAGTVTVRSTAEGFAVLDDGPAIGDEEHAELLQPGGDAPGSRVGLPLVEEVALVHGWELDVEMSDGRNRFAFGAVRPPEDARTVTEDAAERIDEPSVSRPAETLQTTIHYMERLYEITSLEEVSFEETVEDLLELGTKRFGLPNGFLTRIEDGVQLIEVSTGGHPLLQPGESCSLEEAYCRKTIERDEPLSVPDALADSWEDDPAYDTFELGAYVGAKITVDGELYGTLCFAATRPRSYAFSDAERTFIELMAQWVGREIERNRRRAELQRQIERLDQFASVVSHDLRNPLNVAMGNVAAALDGDAGADALADAGAALDRMERLIEDLLALAREGKTVDETESVSLATAAEAAWPVLGDDEATLAVEGDPVLDADPSRLEQLLGNLFRNSIEHGDGAVTVRVGATEDGFFVADDGPGFPEADRERVFDSGYTTAADGTGFGLAIVAEIVEAHGWSVRATESAAGGAKVVIETTG